MLEKINWSLEVEMGDILEAWRQRDGRLSSVHRPRQGLGCYRRLLKQPRTPPDLFPTSKLSRLALHDTRTIQLPDRAASSPEISSPGARLVNTRSLFPLLGHHLRDLNSTGPPPRHRGTRRCPLDLLASVFDTALLPSLDHPLLMSTPKPILAALSKDTSDMPT